MLLYDLTVIIPTTEASRSRGWDIMDANPQQVNTATAMIAETPAKLGIHDTQTIPQTLAKWGEKATRRNKRNILICHNL